MKTKLAIYIATYIAGVVEACPHAEVSVRRAPFSNYVWCFRVALAHAEQRYALTHEVDEAVLEGMYIGAESAAVHEVAHFKRSLKAAQL